jgi:outer membrane protein assembly factor BamB
MLLLDQPGGHPHLAVVGSKEGTLYLLDRDDLGHFHPGDDSQIVQSVQDWLGQVYGTPAYWNGRIYVQAARDYLQAFSLTGGRLSETPVSVASVRYDFPGATVSISANGAANGIAWALQTDAYRRGGRAVLHAYDATDLSLEIYNSKQVPLRDRAGRAVKFAVPTIANGKVYVGAGKRLHVYGLLGRN